MRNQLYLEQFLKLLLLAALCGVLAILSADPLVWIVLFVVGAMGTVQTLMGLAALFPPSFPALKGTASGLSMVATPVAILAFASFPQAGIRGVVVFIVVVVQIFLTTYVLLPTRSSRMK